MRRLTLLALVTACGGGGGGATGDLPTAPPTTVAVASVAVASPSSSLIVGASQQLTATTKDASGNTLTGRAVSWSSSASSIASVSSTGLVTAVAAGSATITATSEGKNGTAALAVNDVFTSLGTILTSADAGVTSGPVADVTATQLADGRVRLYFFGQGQGLRSAISTTSTGTAFTVEAGVRSLTPAWGQPRIIKLSDGRLRLYYLSGDGIHSAVTTDGLAFTDEAGARLSNATVGFTMGAFTIVPTSSGYRAYFSDLELAGAPPAAHFIRSAVSTDLLNWTLEPGVVIGAGATGITLSGSHPFAVRNADGSVTLYYGGARDNGAGVGFVGIVRATSTDGRIFAGEQRLIDQAADPDVITLANGTTIIYHGGGDPNFPAPVIKAAKMN